MIHLGQRTDFGQHSAHPVGQKLQLMEAGFKCLDEWRLEIQAHFQSFCQQDLHESSDDLYSEMGEVEEDLAESFDEYNKNADECIKIIQFFKTIHFPINNHSQFKARALDICKKIHDFICDLGLKTLKTRNEILQSKIDQIFTEPESATTEDYNELSVRMRIHTLSMVVIQNAIRITDDVYKKIVNL